MPPFTFSKNRLYHIGFRIEQNRDGEFTYQGKLMRGNHYALVLPFSLRHRSYVIIPTTSAKPQHFTDDGDLKLKNAVYDPKTRSIFLVDEMEITDFSRNTHLLYRRNGRLKTHQVLLDQNIIHAVTDIAYQKVAIALNKDYIYTNFTVNKRNITVKLVFGKN